MITSQAKRLKIESKVKGQGASILREGSSFPFTRGSDINHPLWALGGGILARLSEKVLAEKKFEMEGLVVYIDRTQALLTRKERRSIILSKKF